MLEIEEVLKEKRTIKQFSKAGNKLVHPLFPTESTRSSASIQVGLYTLGHLWIYELLKKNGYGDYLKDIIQLSIDKKCALFEWEITGGIEKELNSILAKRNLSFSKYLVEGFELRKYSDIIAQSKNKDEPLMRLTRFLVLAELEMGTEIYNSNLNLKEFFEDDGSIINATFLYATCTGKEQNVFNNVPESFFKIIEDNMDCYYEESEMKYYPKVDELSSLLSGIKEIFSKGWYLISDEEQVIISKFLYSIQIVEELSTALMGINGILSAVSTRIIFDNYWQSLYLIKNNKILEYRDFVLKRMRLHILKREDDTDVNMEELLREVKDGILDPIPVNGDYFTKSAREYAIELGLKDEYDKFYEFNSEFIHASLTAVFSGIMVPCKNPEHDGHLTIRSGSARLIDSIPGIIFLLNKHIDLLNSYLKQDVLEQIKVEDFFMSRSEFKEYMNKRM